MYEFFSIIIIVGYILSLYYFAQYLAKGIIKSKSIFFYTVEFIIIICLPVFLFISEIPNQNIDCCHEPPLFSAKHINTLIALFICFTIIYYYTGIRKNIAPPILEIFINSMLIIGIITCFIIAIQITGKDGILLLLLFPPLPILFYIMRLGDNKKLLIRYFATHKKSKSLIINIGIDLLSRNSFIKYPILLILTLPILLLFSSILLLFGQEPDALIKVFTETYKHGFSQLVMNCDNIQCGGHYLCSVAAKGHNTIVKPIRIGERNGSKIICNRQLLISNAFEELIQERIPKVHRIIRRNYNKVGDFIHCYYWVFNNKYFSDLIYILMKPLEWTFLLVLYTCDQNPENRITKQYLPQIDY